MLVFGGVHLGVGTAPEHRFDIPGGASFFALGRRSGAGVAKLVQEPGGGAPLNALGQGNGATTAPAFLDGANGQAPVPDLPILPFADLTLCPAPQRLPGGGIAQGAAVTSSSKSPSSLVSIEGYWLRPLSYRMGL